MAEKRPAKKPSQGSAKRTTATRKTSGEFSPDERAAMKARARELKAQARADRSREDGEREVLAAIAAMQDSDRAMAERIHVLIKDAAPSLSPKTWYGMPAYAKDGKIICFFQDAGKFKARYATFGFSDKANLDKDAMWPTSFALAELSATAEAKIRTLVKEAVS